MSSPLVLSGSSDGLLTISNPTEIDEDEAMLHVRSWGTSISQAGCYCSSANASSHGVWAASVRKHSVSGRTRFSILSEINSQIASNSLKLDQFLTSNIRSPSVHTQSQTWVTDCLIAYIPHQEGLRLHVGSICFVSHSLALI